MASSGSSSMAPTGLAGQRAGSCVAGGSLGPVALPHEQQPGDDGDDQQCGQPDQRPPQPAVVAGLLGGPTAGVVQLPGRLVGAGVEERSARAESARRACPAAQSSAESSRVPRYSSDGSSSLACQARGGVAEAAVAADVRGRRRPSTRAAVATLAAAPRGRPRRCRRSTHEETDGRRTRPAPSAAVLVRVQLVERHASTHVRCTRRRRPRTGARGVVGWRAAAAGRGRRTRPRPAWPRRR